MAGAGRLRRALVAAALAGLLSAGAAAASPEAWSALQAARVLQAVERDPLAAAAAYEVLLDQLAADHPMRGEALYWLGRARFEAGDAGRARAALQRAAAHPRSRPAARAFLGWMSLEERQIKGLPYVEGFSLGTGALVRGWGRGADDDLRLSEGGVVGAAAWRVAVADGEEDFLALPLAPGAGRLTELSLRARAEGFDALLAVVVVDAAGKRFVSPEPLRVRTIEWTELRVDPSALLPEDLVGGGRLDRAAVRRVELVDVTAYHSRARGQHWLFIDELSLR